MFDASRKGKDTSELKLEAMKRRRSGSDSSQDARTFKKAAKYLLTESPLISQCSQWSWPSTTCDYCLALFQLVHDNITDPAFERDRSPGHEVYSGQKLISHNESYECPRCRVNFDLMNSAHDLNLSCHRKVDQLLASADGGCRLCTFFRDALSSEYGKTKVGETVQLDSQAPITFELGKNPNNLNGVYLGLNIAGAFAMLAILKYSGMAALVPNFGATPKC